MTHGRARGPDRAADGGRRVRSVGDVITGTERSPDVDTTVFRPIDDDQPHAGRVTGRRRAPER